MKPLLAALLVLPIFPALFWLSGYDFNQRGEKAVICAILTMLITVAVGSIVAIETHKKP